MVPPYMLQTYYGDVWSMFSADAADALMLLNQDQLADLCIAFCSSFTFLFAKNSHLSLLACRRPPPILKGNYSGVLLGHLTPISSPWSVPLDSLRPTQGVMVR